MAGRFVFQELASGVSRSTSRLSAKDLLRLRPPLRSSPLRKMAPEPSPMSSLQSILARRFPAVAVGFMAVQVVVLEPSAIFSMVLLFVQAWWFPATVRSSVALKMASEPSSMSSMELQSILARRFPAVAVGFMALLQGSLPGQQMGCHQVSPITRIFCMSKI